MCEEPPAQFILVVGISVLRNDLENPRMLFLEI